ncbi:MAG TPA: DUF6624 domain-containing protein [Pseudonocardiaceae bacterium]|nr:DUF6624 domain-containing protein [Pseudonocardiaceae bacterium]
MLPNLAAELLRRQDEDQRARKALISFVRQHQTKGQRRAETSPDESHAMDEVVRIDQANTQWLTNVVERHGWPGQSLVGRDGAAAAWLLAQHADHDPDFQRRCLDLMTAMPTGEVKPHHIAYLTDRVLLAENAPQLYGTQVQQVDGVYQPANLANPESVDQRRASVGLEPLAEYLRHFLDGYT